MGLKVSVWVPPRAAIYKGEAYSGGDPRGVLCMLNGIPSSYNL